MRKLLDGPVPGEVTGQLVVASVLADAHEPLARDLFAFAERSALLHLLGEPLPSPPATVELLRYDAGNDGKVPEGLRARLLQGPVRVAGLAEPVAGEAPVDHPSAAERVVEAWRRFLHDGVARIEHREVTFTAGGGGFEVLRDHASFRVADSLVEQRARELARGRSCEDRGSCTAQTRRYLATEPGVLGILLGLAGGIVWLVLFLGAIAGGKALELLAGFGIGLLGTIALARALRKPGAASG